MSSHVVVVGLDDHDMQQALADAGHTVTHVDIGNRPGLEEAGVIDADVYLLTEAKQATSISVAKDLNPDVKIVVYADESLPDFARGQADLLLDPQLFEPATVAEEISG